MGILTHISSQFDPDERVQRIFAVTKFAPSQRSSLNRVASRASVVTGTGQRTLVAAAYDELGIDIVWREGPVSIVSPEEKWPDAQQINFHIEEIDEPSEAGDVFNIPDRAIPRGKIGDFLKEGLDVFRPDEKTLMMWEIPYEVGGRKR